MRATVVYGAGDVRVENVPDTRLVEPTDALVRVTRAAICGGDIWPYNQMQPSETGQRMGHEFIGIVAAIGADVRTVKAGDVVIAPDAWSDGTCVFCREGLHTSCLHGGWWASDGIDGGQGEGVRVPEADGTLVILPVGRDDALMPSLLTLSDVMGTGHHAALAAEVAPAKPSLSSATVPSACAALSRRRGSARSGSFFSAVILLGSLSRRSSAPRTSSASAATRLSSVSASSRAASEPTPCSSASVTNSRRSRRSASPVRGAQSAGSAFRSGSRSRQRSRPSSRMSPSAAVRPPPARISRSSYRTSSKAGSSPAAYSIASRTSTAWPDGYRAMNEREAIK